MAGERTWTRLLLLLCLGLLVARTTAQDEGSGDEASGEVAEGEAEAEASGEEEVAEDGGSGEGEDGGDAGEEEDGEEEDGEDAEEEEEECEVMETDGSGEGDDDVANILALGGEDKKCKPKASSDSDGSGDSDVSGADALAEALGPTTCDKEGMDPKVSECLEGLEGKVNDLMTAIMGPEGGEGTLEDKIALVLVKKGVISCEDEDQCDDNKQCLPQDDGMSRCQNPCERPEIIQCRVAFSECVSEEHQPSCRCKENFHGNGTEVCIPMGFDTEANKRGYRMFGGEYVEWENATQKCQELGARLPVLSDAETIEIVKNYLNNADFGEVFEKFDSSRRVWLGLNYNPGSGLVWADGARVVAYPESSRLFVWESRRLLSQEVSSADSSRHYGYYIDGDIAKLPGGGRRGAAVLCELIPDELASDPNPHQPGDVAEEPDQSRGGYRDSRYPQPGAGGRYRPRYPGMDDGGYPSYPQGR